MNILFTSVGRRVELLQMFREAANKLNVALTIWGVDIAADAPALQFCDKKELACRISDPDYIPGLLRLCRREKIDCLIPTIDTDLLLLAENKSSFEAAGTKVLIAFPEKIKLCRDKNLTSDYFISLGLKAPQTVNSVEDYIRRFDFPAFIKPKDGSSSINAYKVDDVENLRLYADNIQDYVIQPYIAGDEYTVDVFCDYNGNEVFITPRRRLAVRAGEVLKTKIIQDETIIAEMRRLVADFKPSGAITVQLIKDKLSGDNYYIEINPRFGGGAPLSMKAGADSAEAVLKMLCGDDLAYIHNATEDNAVYCRFDQSVRVK